MFSNLELRAFHIPLPVPSPGRVWHVLNKATSVVAGVGDGAGKILVLRPLNTVVTHVPVVGPLTKGVATKAIMPGGHLVVHGIVEADNLAGHVINNGEKMATVSVAIGKPVVSGLGWAADNVGCQMINLRFTTAQTVLAEASQMEKAKRIVTEVQVAGGFASQAMDDIKNASLGHAGQDLTELVVSGLAAASKGRIQQTEVVFSNTRSALVANLEAIGCLHQGQWTRATVAIGQGMTAAGNIVTAAGHAEMGMAITQGGQAVEVAAPYAGHLTQVFTHMKSPHPPNVVMENHPDPKKAALSLSQAAVLSAKTGRFQEATLQATLAVALISGAGNESNARVADTAISSAQAALAAMKEGQVGLANGNAADALEAAGKAIFESDPHAGHELINDAMTLHGCMNGAPIDIARAQ